MVSIPHPAIVELKKNIFIDEFLLHLIDKSISLKFLANLKIKHIKMSVGTLISTLYQLQQKLSNAAVEGDEVEEFLEKGV